MIFLGRTFCGARNSIDYTPISTELIDFLRVQEAVYDTLYVSTDASRDYTTTIPDEWTFDTALSAKFNGNLYAGNVDLTLEQVSGIKIKRRKVNTYDWIDLFEVPVASIEDANFERFDKYCRANTEYEYAAVPVLNGVEGSGKHQIIKSMFEGVFVMEKDKTYSTSIEVELSVNRNAYTSVVNPLGRKYPYVINNSKNNYSFGSIRGVFVHLDPLTCTFDFEGSYKYRDEFLDFLKDGKPKILKFDDGRMWMISIIDEITIEADEHPDKVVIEFNWIEIADCESAQDLYDNDFIDEIL